MLKLLLSLCLLMSLKYSSEIMGLIFLLYFVYIFNIQNRFLLVDKLSINLILLTILILILCKLTNNILNKNKTYSRLISSLLIFLVLSFSVKRFFNFFVMFESSLIPLFLIILGWGYQSERLQASFYFLFYTLIGSLPLLIRIIILSGFWSTITWNDKNKHIDLFIFIFLLLAFLIKMPMFLCHLWLPKAHVEAPTIGSMVLAGVTWKLGSYAILRLLNMNSYYILNLNWTWIAISIVGNIILCIVCMRQIDLKSLIAYSSVVHMGLCLISTLFVYNWRFEGSLWLSISHGLASSGLFYLTNCLYIRFNRRNMFINKGLCLILPARTLWWFLMVIFNMASPPSLNLFREIKLITSTIPYSIFILIMSVISGFLCGGYCIYLFNNIIHGKYNSFQKFSNSFIISEHFISFIHLLPLILRIIIINFIQWILYLFSLSKIMICGIIDNNGFWT